MDDTSVKFSQFVDKYWHLASLKPKDQPTEDDLMNIKRGRWYCNFTGKPVKELQKFNAVDNFEVTFYSEDDDDCYDDDESDDDDTDHPRLSEQFYKKGYDSYHVYKCGHCFIDIYLLSGLFDYVNSCYSTMIDLREEGEDAVHEHVDKHLRSYYTECLCCQGKRTEDDRLSLYTTSTSLDIGTIIRRDCVIPKKHLGAISHEIKEGDVIDTDGYRGIGLYIYEGGQIYSKVPTGEYYPIWPIENLKSRGYLYYLTETPESCFDELPFENDIRAIYNGDHLVFIDDDNDEAWEFDEKNNQITVNLTNEKIAMISNDEQELSVEKMENEDYFKMPYPFYRAKQANLLLYSGLPLKAQLTQNEYLVFKDRNTYIETLDGKIKHQVDYF